MLCKGLSVLLSPEIPVAAGQESDTVAFPLSQVPASLRLSASGLTATYVPGKGGPATYRPAPSTAGLKAPATRAKVLHPLTLSWERRQRGLGSHVMSL